MSEQSYLKAPSSANARVDIAGVEGSLEFISENIGNEWCTMEDVKRLVDEAHKTLEGARQELRDAESNISVGARTEWVKAARTEWVKKL